MFDNVGGDAINDAHRIGTGSINFTPQSRVTAPDTTDWHLVADHELDRLARPEAGTIGAIGFAGLGAMLGALPSGCVAMDKVATAQVVTRESYYSMLILLISLATASLCLITFGFAKYKNSGLLKTIRSRPTRTNDAKEDQ